MVKKVVILLILATIIGCSGEKKQNTTTQKENIKIVKSIKLEEKTIANIKKYNGELKTSTGDENSNYYWWGY